MNKKEIYQSIEKQALERYANRFRELGETPRALGWGCKEDQLERFEAMYQNVDFNGKTVMDIGCGFANWYEYMLSKGVTCNYIGVDIVPDFLDVCQKKYPEATFIRANIMLGTEGLPEADIILTNGTLNFKQSQIDNFEYTKDFVEIAFNHAKEMLIFDFLSTKLTPSYPREDQVYYHDPKQVIDLAFGYTDNIKLVHNYKPIPQKEGMIILYK